MNVITTQSELEDFCSAAGSRPFVCVDTEFMRESTFYSILCLVQLATDKAETIVDPLAKGLDLKPLIKLLMNNSVMKVMHAARQDMEIFYQICGDVPAPLFDTQIAAMALGFGESVGYNALVKGRLNINLDKGARFTDWARRPLSTKQLHYALGDVTHLRDLYPGIVAELKERGRLEWVEEEMKGQLNPTLYTFDSETAWERLRIRNLKRDYLAALKGAAAWREDEAKARNIPRRRVMKDDALYDLALNRPKDREALGRLRGIPNGFEKSRYAQGLIDKIKFAVENADSYAPAPPIKRNMPSNLGPTIDMLKTLLRLRCEYQDIAPRLVANAADVELIAAFGSKAGVAALTGWRREVFGADALEMCKGNIALRLKNREVVAERINNDTDA